MAATMTSSTMEQPSSIEVTTRSDLSLLYRVLRTVIRPLRPRLVKPGKPLPAGSPKLKRPSSKCKIEERKSHDIYLYDFHPPGHDANLNASRTSLHQIFYFAGGGFQSPPSSEHWKMCAELSIRLEATHHVTIVSYPLAPNSSAKESLAMLRPWLEGEMRRAGEIGQRVTLMGDSAGGNIVLSLAIWWAGQKDRLGDLVNVMAISPATDLRNVNEGIKDADTHDPVLTIGLTTSVGKTWAGSLGTSDPTVSPNLADLSVLAQSNVRIHGVVGTHDVLGPDAIVFRDLCAKYIVSGKWLQWEGQMHCFPLASVYGLREGKDAMNWIIDVLKQNP
jgi:acetyl esterase/lipase